MHTVLFVDDVPLVTAALKRRLRQEPFRILEAHSAAEALQRLDEGPVDVVVTDEAMPGQSGSELIARIYQRNPEIVCMILTGHPTVDAAMRAINQGHVYRFLTKPCDPNVLSALIRQALREREVGGPSRCLAHRLEEEAHRVEQLEAAHPGITHVERDDNDVVILE